MPERREHMNEKKIPLTIGITGHLNPRMRDTLALRDAVKRELTKIRTRCPHTPIVMLCSLARGADLLCAEAAEEVGVSLRAVLPMEQAVYEKDFEPKDLARLRWQLERAQTVITVPPAAEEEPASGVSPQAEPENSEKGVTVPGAERKALPPGGSAPHRSRSPAL